MSIMTRYPAERKQETRRRILAASEALMKARGVEAASVEAVMRSAGLTVGGFYAHFPSKEALASETLLHGLARSFGAMEAALDGLAGRDWVSGMIRTYLAQADDPDLAHACPMTLLLPEVARADDARKARFAEVTGALLDRAAARFPAVAGFSPREAVLATYAALAGAVALARTAPAPAARQAITGACERMLVAWLGLDEEAPGASGPRGRPGGVTAKRPRSRRAR